jgi:hypothetical protein
MRLALTSSQRRLKNLSLQLLLGTVFLPRLCFNIANHPIAALRGDICQDSITLLNAHDAVLKTAPLLELLAYRAGQAVGPLLTGFVMAKAFL